MSETYPETTVNTEQPELNRNPYAQQRAFHEAQRPQGWDTPPQAAPQATQAPQQPQPPQNLAQPQPPRPQANVYTPPQPPVAPPRYPQAPPRQQPVQPKKDPHAAARAYGMVSFVIGCFILPIAGMIYFNFRTAVSTKFAAAMYASLFLAVPALIFAVISLMKKPENKLFPLLGLCAAVFMMLCAYVTYFFMVNTAPV